MKRKKTVALIVAATVLTVTAVLFGLFVDLVGFTARRPDMTALDPAVLREIQEDYVALVDPAATPDRVVIAEYGGSYGDCTVVMLEGVLFCTQAVRSETVAGIRFHYNDGNTFYAWREGELLPLKEAYAKGFLSRSEVRRVRDIHNAYLRG